MPLLLVRHAHAVARSRWRGDDFVRDLSERGRVQSEELVEALRGYEPKRILSSPLIRCMDTVAPLGLALGLRVEPEEALAEGAGGLALDLVRALSTESAVLCSHGDVIPEILTSLAETDGLDLGRNPLVEKGSVWVIFPHRGRLSKAAYLAPPKAVRRGASKHLG
jgi:8-oxo-dGTP diphosphatase